MNASLMALMAERPASSVDRSPPKPASDESDGGFEELLGGMRSPPVQEATPSAPDAASRASKPPPTGDIQREGETMPEGNAEETPVIDGPPPQDATDVQVASDDASSSEVEDAVETISRDLLALLSVNASPETLDALPADMPADVLAEMTDEMKTVADRLRTVPQAPVQSAASTDVLPEPVGELPEDPSTDETLSPTEVLLSRLAAQTSEGATSPTETTAVPEPVKSSEAGEKPADAEPKPAAEMTASGVKAPLLPTDDGEAKGESASSTGSEDGSAVEEDSPDERVAIGRAFEGRAEQLQQSEEPAVQEVAARVVSTKAEPAAPSTSDVSSSETKSHATMPALSASTTSADSGEGRGEDAGGLTDFGTNGRGAGGAEKVGRGQVATDVSADASRLADRMVRFVRANLGHLRSTVEMRLNPPELGSMRMSMTVQKGQVSLSLETSTEAARHLVSQHVGQLRQALTAQGYEVESLNVSLGQTFAQAQTAQQESQQQTSAGGYHGTDASPEVSPTESTVTIPHPSSRILDVIA